MSDDNLAEIKLEFDTPQFLQSLFANEPRNLAYLETKLGVRAVTRDGWVLISGNEEAVERAKAVFYDLEQARRNGADISTRDVHLSVDVAADGGDVKVAKLAEVPCWACAGASRSFQGRRTSSNTSERLRKTTSYSA
jgi:phosphate starvation-inducible PhoH-like protein